LGAWRLGEHSGTHLGAPVHFLEGGRTVDGYGPEELRWPLWLLDSEGADGSLSRLVRAEERQGRVPEGALVVLRTGWEERWPDHRRVFPPDMAADPWPGFLEEAVEWLVGERGVRALGSDAPGIDPARDAEFLAGRAMARAGGVHLENLANLRLLPRTGAEVLAAPLPLAGGAGSPCRAFALLP
jgi:kynurenine formamidase